MAWYPTHHLTPDELAFLFWEMLDECESRGLNIHALVADGLSVNRSFFKVIAGTKKIPLDGLFTAPNPYATERPIFLCSDPQHLLKVALSDNFRSYYSSTVSTTIPNIFLYPNRPRGTLSTPRKQGDLDT